MHTNWHVLIEMSMEIGMLNFWSMINCLCNGAWNSLSPKYINSQYPLITYLTESYEHINDLIAFYGEGILLTTVSIFGLIGNIMSIIVLTRSINGRASGGNHINIGLSVGGTSFSNLLRGLATFDALFLLVSWYFKSATQQCQIRYEVALKVAIICHWVQVDFIADLLYCNPWHFLKGLRGLATFDALFLLVSWYVLLR